MYHIHKKYIGTEEMSNFLSAHPTATHQEISSFIQQNTNEVYLGWDKYSICEALDGVNRVNEFEDLSDEQHIEILDSFAVEIIDNHLDRLERIMLETINITQDKYNKVYD